ncbi:hypothetical protein M0R19_04835 [Candidatus Pacearchaeota archaeon]|jgi:hypothetical protein|nr:hypothetical protein [Candidatus Pacearchaeota archaeon]
MKIFKKKLRKNFNIFVNNSSYGNSIRIFSDNKDGTYTVSAYTYPRPNEKDGLILDMQSGKKALYIITEIDYCQDPADMWFSKITFLKYIDNVELEVLLEKKVNTTKEEFFTKFKYEVENG